MTTTTKRWAHRHARLHSPCAACETMIFKCRCRDCGGSQPREKASKYQIWEALVTVNDQGRKTGGYVHPACWSRLYRESQRELDRQLEAGKFEPVAPVHVEVVEKGDLPAGVENPF